MAKVPKTFLICFILILSHGRLSAQSSLNIGVNVDAGNKWFQPQDKLGYGASLEYVPTTWKERGLRLFLGYDLFKLRVPNNVDPQRWQDSIKTFGVTAHTVSLVPIRIGYEQLLWNAAIISGEIGVAHLITDSEYAGNKNMLTSAFGIGYRIYIQNKNYVKLSCNYNYNSLKRYQKLNYFSLKLAFGFQLQKLKK